MEEKFGKIERVRKREIEKEQEQETERKEMGVRGAVRREKR